MGQTITLNATSSSGLPVTYAMLSGNATLTGTQLTLQDANPVVVRATQAGNDQYASASAEQTVTANRVTQQVNFSSPTGSIIVGQPSRLGATASSGLPITYVVVSGPAAISGDVLTVTGTGTVVVRATQAGNTTFSAASAEIAFTGELPPTGKLINLSARAYVSEGDSSRSFIAGFVISGPPKRVLLRAAGPVLQNYGVQNPLPNPTLRLFNVSSVQIAENQDWSGDDIAAAASSVGAFPLAVGSRDASLVTTLQPGNYSVQVVPNGGTGVALAEIYDMDGNAAATPLINISTRGYVDNGENVLTAGFVVSGNAPKRLLIRGVGPTLAGYGVTGVLTDPLVALYQNGQVIAQNDDWGTAQTVGTLTPATGAEIIQAASAAGAFPLTASSRDSAIIVTLPPGLYSAVVSPATGNPGAGLVEVYELR